MRSHFFMYGALALLSAVLGTGCHQPINRNRPPPPSAQRPVIKTEAELAAQRVERIKTGQVVESSSPVLLGAERIKTDRPSPPPPVRPTQGAIEADVLMINKSALTTAEVLYPLRDELVEIRRAQTPGGFQERARQLVREETQRQIGTLLIYAEATANLNENQRKALDDAVRKEVETLTARDFGASSARLKAHLAENGLTLDQFKGALERSIVARQYTRERLLPQIQIRRDELLSYYRRNVAQYRTAETRELEVIELPFARLLPADQDWDSADRTLRAAAKLAAARKARAAHEALNTRPFEEVAKEYSLGLHAEQGGSWGMIGRPLQPPYDQISKLVFEYTEGQYGGPLETETGWYIVRCGRIEAATERSFADVQDEIRQDLMERRFARLSADYILRLAEKATISSLDTFVTAAVKRAVQNTTPATAGR